MLFKKVICSLMAFGLMCVGVNTFAGETNDNLLCNYYYDMQKGSFKNNSYGWKGEFYAEKPVFSDGVIGGKIGDFDSDNDLELLVVKIENSQDKRDDAYDVYGKAYLEIYEVESQRVKMSAKTKYFTFLDSSTDAGGLECFVKNNYIVLQCATQNNTFADGASQYINIYSYKNNNFNNEISMEFSGSAVSGEEFIDEANKLNSLGFYESCAYFSKQWFSPYFIG
ncbi:MAG: hypothetical protein ACI4VF_01760, partial [Lachnospirales bacterium]